jgi:ABC-type transport system involved in multi-copper enzyme maturation permease subunit
VVRPPVLERELLAASRYWGTYWLRVLAGLMMVTGLVALLVVRRWGSVWFGGSGLSGVTPSFLGALLFGGFHTVLTVTFLWLCPVLTADCLSRERREGTLGLLFLTPLNAWDVVLGKGLAHVLRAFGLWFSTVPFLAVPFLMGGVQGADFARAVAIELTVVLIGLSAGFLATCRATRWASAMLLALGFTVLLWVLMLGICAGALYLGLLHYATKPTDLPPAEAFFLLPFAVIFALVAAGGVSSSGAGGPVPTWVIQSADVAVVAIAVFALAVFVLSILLAGWSLNQSRLAGRAGASATGQAARRWTKWREGWRRQRRRRRWLEENPIRWLQAWSPFLSWGRWGWFGAMALAWAVAWALGTIEREFEYVGWSLPPILLLIQALAAAGSFRQEVEEGTMELLLVTTLPTEHLVWGRARALWATFGPAILLGVLLQLLLGKASDLEGWWYESLIVISTWLTLPMVGMRCAMRRLHPLLGWLLVLAWGVVAPALVGGVAVIWFNLMLNVETPMVWVLTTMLAQFAAAAWWGRMTIWDLDTRNFMKRPLQGKSG